MTMSAAGRDGTGFAAAQVFSVIVAGLICGVLAVVISIGAGSLLFTGGLRPYVPLSAGMALAATTVIATVVALTSSIRGAVAPIQEVPVVALATVAAAVGAAMPDGAGDQAILATCVVAVAIATLIVGLVGLLLGHLRWGAIIRFVPYPVIGGFLAGTGWLIVVGGFGLVIGETPGFDVIERLGELPVAANVGLAVVFIAMLVVIEARATGPLALPVAIILTLVVFNIGVILSSIDREALHGYGWLVQVPHGGSLWPPIAPDEFRLVDWSAVAIGMIRAPIMVVVTIIALLMNETGIEIASRTDVDLDRELRAVGGANLAAGIVGGMPGFPSVSLTLLAIRLGAANRFVGLVVAAVSLGALVLGAVLLDLIPTFLLGGILIWIGGALLLQWLVRSYRRLDLWEYLVIVMIFAVIVGVGFAEGIVLGLIAAVILFVVQYGQIDTVRLSLTGKDYQSSAAASEERRRLLTELGDAILIVRLQGFLFFGTADRLRRSLAHYSAEAGGGSIRYLIIDFGRVTGIDSSTVLSFIRLAQVAERDGFTVVLSGLAPHHHDAMVRGELDLGPDRHVRVEPDIDAALKWCEDALLTERSPDFSADRPRAVVELLTGILDDEEMAQRLAPHLDKVTVPAATPLIEEGAASDVIFLIESGHAAVEIRSRLDAPIRLATLGPGAIVGELAYYLKAPGSAAVIALEDMVVWRLSRTALDRLTAESPGLALAFHHGIATMLSRRLTGTNRILRFLAD
jgi:sulfate permease, SulP family